MRTSLVVGTRNSQLALWQAHRVQRLLKDSGHSSRLEEIVTRGDRVQDVPMSEVGDESIFTKELDHALLDERVDLAVHSLKDLPSRLPDGLTLAAVSERAEPFDAFVAHPSFSGMLRDLPEGAQIATSALRRRAQLLAWRPDLQIVPVRGNVDTRLDKLDESDWDGMVLAAAGLVRMDLEDRISERISSDIMVPAVGQGALGIVCREDRPELKQTLKAAIQVDEARTAANAERAFMKQIGGGCQVPTGAWATLEKAGTIKMVGCVASGNGHTIYRQEVTGEPGEAQEMGRNLANVLLESGGLSILRDMGLR